MSQPPYQGPYPPPQGPGAPYAQGAPGYPPPGPPPYQGGPPGGGGRKKRRLPIVITAIVAAVLLGGVLVVAMLRQDSAPEGEVDFAALPAAKFPKVQVPKLDAVGFTPEGTGMCGAVAKVMTGRYYAGIGAQNDQGYGDAKSTVCRFATSALSLQKQGAKSLEVEVGGWRTESESDAARSFQRELDIAEKHSGSFKDVKLERLPIGDAGFLHSYVFGKKGTAVAIVRSGQDFVRVKVEGQLLKIGKTNRFGLGDGVASPDEPVPAEVRHAEIAGIL